MNPDQMMKDDEKQKPKELGMLEMSTLFYGLMVIIGAGVCLWSYQNLREIFSLPTDKASLEVIAASVVLGIGILKTASYLLTSWFPSFRLMQEAMAELFVQLSVPSLIYLAFISAIGEELLFRGAIQPFLGLGLTSVLFGLLHWGPGGGISLWTVWATGAGLLLGWIYQQTASLLAPIAIHFVVNATSLLYLSRRVKSAANQNTEDNQNPPSKA